MLQISKKKHCTGEATEDRRGNRRARVQFSVFLRDLCGQVFFRSLRKRPEPRELRASVLRNWANASTIPIRPTLLWETV